MRSNTTSIERLTSRMEHLEEDQLQELSNEVKFLNIDSHICKVLPKQHKNLNNPFMISNNVTSSHLPQIIKRTAFEPVRSQFPDQHVELSFSLTLQSSRARNYDMISTSVDTKHVRTPPFLGREKTNVKRTKMHPSNPIEHNVCTVHYHEITIPRIFKNCSNLEKVKVEGTCASLSRIVSCNVVFISGWDKDKDDKDARQAWVT